MLKVRQLWDIFKIQPTSTTSDLYGSVATKKKEEMVENEAVVCKSGSKCPTEDCKSWKRNLFNSVWGGEKPIYTMGAKLVRNLYHDVCRSLSEPTTIEANVRGM